MGGWVGLLCWGQGDGELAVLQSGHSEGQRSWTDLAWEAHTLGQMIFATLLAVWT